MPATAATLAPEATHASETSPDSHRDQIAAETVSRYAAWGAAAGVIPLPVVDVVAIGGIQIQMLRRLADIYDVPFSENLGKSLIATLLGSILPASAAPATAIGVASVLKYFPLVGTTLASLSMPALSGAATYAIGKVFIQHFAAGGTLLDFNPQDYREFMKAQAERARAEKTKTTTTESARGPSGKGMAS